MTEEKTTVTGTVSSIGKWPSGKGYYTTLEGDSRDFYYYGGLKANVGEKVVFEVTPGTKIYVGKFQVQRRLRDAPPPLAAATKVEVEKKVIEERPPQDAPVYASQTQLIVEQCCMKAAAKIVARLYPRKEKFDMDAIADAAIQLKDKFAMDILGAEDIHKEKQEE